MFGWLKKSLGGLFRKDSLKGYRKLLVEINHLEKEISALSDSELKEQTTIFRELLQQGKSLESILPRAFAVVRETTVRVLGLRLFDVQILGGLALNDGKVAEMNTGEGKTLVATLPVYLNALTGHGVHVVTVNDYLVKRDSAWMGAIYRFLGLSVGAVTPGMNQEEKQTAYNMDIVYGTSRELGFDYLRTNMVFSTKAALRQNFHYAIIDEADSILIDEARTPLVISGPHEVDNRVYHVADRLVKWLTAEDYEHDEKRKTATLNDAGATKMEKLLAKEGLIKPGASMYDVENILLLHHLNQSLRAHVAFHRNRDYVVKNGKILLIDEFTGRLAMGKKFAGGLHQALEAKEKLRLEPETQTLGVITLQNFFRMYKKIAGMTGTALTEAEELKGIYNLEVVSIPPNVPCQREDLEDEVYRKEAGKFAALSEYVIGLHKTGQPILIGTANLDYSQKISEMLHKAKIKHERLDAQNHEREAAIIDQAGRKNAVTIAASMAGRGTDIQLGGNAEGRIRQELADVEGPERAAREELIRKEVAAEREAVKALGGLCVIATERHESRRVDNQLRGRSGRQGDPGHSKFFVSLEDDLMRIFGAERMDGVLQTLGVKDDEVISHAWITKAIERAQQKLEAYNYDLRIGLLRYDNVMNEQRSTIYEKRQEVLAQDDMTETVKEMIEEAIENLVHECIPAGSYADQWDGERLQTQVRQLFDRDIAVKEWLSEDGVAEKQIIARLNQISRDITAENLAKHGKQIVTLAEKQFLLLAIDTAWKQHLYNLDCLKQSIGLRAYGQKNPLNEYKKEAFSAFENLLVRIPFLLGQMLHRFKISSEQANEERISGQTPVAGAEPAEDKLKPLPPGIKLNEIRRNQPCPCQSGKKFKHCHGKLISKPK